MLVENEFQLHCALIAVAMGKFAKATSPANTETATVGANGEPNITLFAGCEYGPGTTEPPAPKPWDEIEKEGGLADRVACEQYAENVQKHARWCLYEHFKMLQPLAAFHLIRPSRLDKCL